MIEKSKLIQKISKKAKISEAKAKLAYECVLKETPAFRKQSLKTVEVKKEVAVKVAGKMKVQKVNLRKEVAVKAKDIVEKVKIVEVIKEVPVEVIKEIKVIKPVEVIKEVPITVIKEVIKEVQVVKEKPIEVIKEITLVNEVFKRDDTELKKIKSSYLKLEKEYSKLQKLHKSSIADYKKKLSVKPKTIEVIKEIPVEIIKEVEVVKSFDMAALQKMMKGMKTVQVSKKVVGESRTRGTSKIVERREVKAGSSKVSTKKKSSSSKSKTKKSSAKDDLTKVEGIGPAIQKLLNSDGINTFKALAGTKQSKLIAILNKGGSRFKMHDPKTWPAQSKMAANGDWKKLKKWQDELDGGK